MQAMMINQEGSVRIKNKNMYTKEAQLTREIMIKKYQEKI